MERLSDYSYLLTDSTHLILTDIDRNKFFYRKSSSDLASCDEEIRDFIRKDSSQQLVQGWWKVLHAVYRPISLINDPDPINDFTLDLNPDGNAVFYKDNYTDSPLNYTWKGEGFGFSLEKGCIVGAPAKVLSYTKDTMSILMDRAGIDTLTLIRVKRF
ncbi:hypothetical protein ACTHGU_01210 [Chitinophagaceae bacterium MMS25-I14]